MMEWVLAILFGVAVILFILSFIKTDSTKMDKQLEQITSTFGDELSQLQEKLRNIEIDTEIMAQELGLSGSADQRLMMREVLDLHKRGYSLQSIATKKGLTTNEIEGLLAPYIKTKDERRKVANDI